MGPFILVIIEPLFGVVLPTLLAVAFYTLGERKVIGAVQWRVGPDVIGFEGLLQPLIDGVKLMFKEGAAPLWVNWMLFILGPMIVFSCSILNWMLVPSMYYAASVDWDMSLMFVIVFSTLSGYGILLAGWSSDSVYAFMGAVWSVSQLLAYEIVIGLIIFIFGLVLGTLNILDIIAFQEALGFNLIGPLFPIALIFYISILAETNRAPFDLAEAESELVAGYNVEYAGLLFTLFFLAEYLNMLSMSLLFVVLFLGSGSAILFTVKSLLVAVSLLVIRAAVPRYWFDQLLDLGWVYFIPVLLGVAFLLLISCNVVGYIPTFFY